MQYFKDQPLYLVMNQVHNMFNGGILNDVHKIVRFNVGYKLRGDISRYCSIALKERNYAAGPLQLEIFARFKEIS